MRKLKKYPLDKAGVAASHITHLDGQADGIRIVVNVSLSVKEIGYFADVVEDVIEKNKIARKLTFRPSGCTKEVKGWGHGPNKIFTKGFIINRAEKRN